MIYLYDKDTRDFKYHGIPLPSAYEVDVNYTLNDEFFVNGRYPIDVTLNYKLIKEDKIVKCHTPDGMQPFRIVTVRRFMGYVEFEAWPLFYADMRSKLIRPLQIPKGNGLAAIGQFEQNLLSDTPFNFTTNIIDVHDYHTQTEDERESNGKQLYNALEVFRDLVNRWSAEVVINGYDIRLLNRVGEDKQVLLYEKKNITDFVDETSIKPLVTRVYGKSEWTEDIKGTRNDKKHSIEVTIDSPLIDTYGGVIHERQYTNNDLRSKKELEDWLRLKFTTEHIDKPRRSIELDTNFVDGHELSVGDGLILKYLKHDIDEPFRMTGYIYDGFEDRYKKVLIGSVKSDMSSQIGNQISSNIDSIKQSLKKSGATGGVTVNDLGNKNIFSEEKPTGNFRDGDVWFDQNNGMWFWSSELQDWTEHPYNRNMNLVKNKITKIESDWSGFTSDFESAQEENEQKLQEFNSHLTSIEEQFNTQIKDLEQTNTTSLDNFKEQLEQFNSRLGELDSLDEQALNDFREKIKAFDTRIDELSLSNTHLIEEVEEQGKFGNAIDDMEKRLANTEERTNITFEMIGDDGQTKYSKNRATQNEAEIPLGTETVQLTTNLEDGWDTSKTYTVSFEAECVKHEHTTVTFDMEHIIGDVGVVLTPGFSYYPTVEETLNKTSNRLYGVFLDEYTIQYNPDWYQPKQEQVTIEKGHRQVLTLTLKEVADGNLTHKYIGEWSANPEIILDGGGG